MRTPLIVSRTDGSLLVRRVRISALRASIAANKHPDLRQASKSSDGHNGVPPAFQHLSGKIADL